MIAHCERHELGEMTQPNEYPPRRRTQKDIVAAVLNLPAVWRKRLAVARAECIEVANKAMAEMAAAEQRKIKALLDCGERLERIEKTMRKAASSALAAVADKAERDSTC